MSPMTSMGKAPFFAQIPSKDLFPSEGSECKIKVSGQVASSSREVGCGGRRFSLPNVHVLHAIGNLALVQERAIERDDVGVVAVMHDLQLAQDLLPYRRLCVDVDHLQRQTIIKKNGVSLVL